MPAELLLLDEVLGGSSIGIKFLPYISNEGVTGVKSSGLLEC